MHMDSNFINTKKNQYNIEEDQIRKLRLPDFKTSCKTAVIKTYTNRLMKENRQSRNRSTQIESTDL